MSSSSVTDLTGKTKMNLYNLKFIIMIKHILSFTASVALLGLLSCSQEPAPEHLQATVGGRLTIEIGPEPSTKSAYSERQDNQISCYQVLVFDAQGRLETDYYSEITPTSNSVSVNIATFTGTKTVYAVVNYKRLTLAKDYSLSTFEALTSDLKDNSPTKLVMVGKNEVTVTEYDKNKNPSAAPQSMSIYVKRLAAMVVLDKITVDFSKTSLAGASFSIQEIYLKNVVGKCHLGLSGLTGSENADVLPNALDNDEHTNYDNWYNKGTKQATGAPEVTVDSWSHNCPEVAGGAGNALGRCLFAYPNKTTTDSHDSVFSQRMTRLVIKALVTKADVTPAGGVSTYYVFDLPVLLSNRVYRVSKVDITMLGKDNDDSDEDLQAGKVSPMITVDNWVDAAPLNFEF